MGGQPQRNIGEKLSQYTGRLRKHYSFMLSIEPVSGRVTQGTSLRVSVLCNSLGGSFVHFDGNAHGNYCAGRV